MRKIHIKYGTGIILKDVEGLCNTNEVLFKPDNGITDRLVQPDATKALSIVAPYDIVLKTDLN